MGHHHHHHADHDERQLWKAIVANVALTFAQVVGGMVSGSLALVADALHNFSDAAALLIALVGLKIGRKPADQFNTFGYKRAETVAALINLVSLIFVGLLLCYEAITRAFTIQEPISGWIVVLVAGGALAVDAYTAWLTWRQSKDSLNFKAVFLHNLTDALTSVGVILTGVLIVLFDWTWVDLAMTLLISGYILWQGFIQTPKAIHLLMEGTPEGLSPEEVIAAMSAVAGVLDVHHVHLWRIDENRNALEAHIRIHDALRMDEVKTSLKTLLKTRFAIAHSTLELEHQYCGDDPRSL